MSPSIHKSLDGTRVNYAQAKDYKSWEAIVAKVQEKGFFERFQELSKPNPCLYHCFLQPQLRLIHNELSSSDFVNFHLRFEATVYNQSSSK
jgi:hypothetical protein